MLRSFCLVSGALALGVAVLGFFPGYGFDGCCTCAEATVASSPPWLAAVLAAFAALGAFVWRRPLLANALLWSVLSIGLSVFMLAFTGPPLFDSGFEATALPAAVIANRLLIALMVVQLVLLPVACGLFALATRAPKPDRIARARVHRIGRRRA